nr:ketopantoate reductase C-terminal domain-containing protein [Komagataeibacter diospyri]
MWDKWVLLAALGSICCLMRGTVGDVASQPAGQDCAQAVIHECALTTATSGAPLFPLKYSTVDRLAGRSSHRSRASGIWTTSIWNGSVSEPNWNLRILRATPSKRASN